MNYIAFLLSFLYAVYLGAFGVALPAVGETFGLGAAVQGQLFPASFGGAVVGLLTSGVLSDRFGRKPVLLVGILIATGGLILFGRATTFPMALLGVACVGIGGSAAQGSATALLSDMYSSRRAFYANAMQVAFGVGAIVAAPTMMQILRVTGEWRGLYLGLGLLFAFVFLILLRFPVPERSASGGFSWAALRRLLREPLLPLLCLSGALYAGSEVAFFSWLPTWLKTEVSGGAMYAGSVSSVFWAAMTIGRSLVGNLLQRYPLRQLRLVFAAASTLFCAVTLLMSHPALILVGVVLTGLGMSAIFGVLLGEGSEAYPEAAGTTIGMISAISGIGASLLPFVVGLLHEGGLPFRLALALIPLSCLAIVLLGSRR